MCYERRRCGGLSEVQQSGGGGVEKAERGKGRPFFNGCGREDRKPNYFYAFLQGGGILFNTFYGEKLSIRL